MRCFNLILFFLIGFSAFSQEYLIKHEGVTNILNAGGKLELERLISNELNYPSDAYQNEIEGYVQFNFTISQNGIISNLNVSGDQLESFKPSAEDLLKKIMWLPTTKRPQNYPVKFVIIYNPKKFKKLAKKRGYEKVLLPEISFSNDYKTINFNEIEIKPIPIFTEGNFKSADQYFNSKINYPESAIRLGLSGPVTLEYVIETSGNITNIHIVEPLGGGCNEEAIRVLTSLKWKPGVQNNQSYRVKAKTTMYFGSR